MGIAEIVERCERLHEDIDFTAAREWKAAEPGRRVIGYLPVYVPEEIIHAAGMLPLGITGGGDQMEVIHGDAYYQSYICRIPRSTIELGITGRLDFVDGMIFPSICDVIRNLSGMWKLMFPDKYVRYLDVPQNYRDDIGGEFYRNEMRELLAGLEALSGRRVSDDDINASIRVYNRNRELVRTLYALRSDQPWQVPTTELYLLSRAGLVLPVEEHNQLLEAYLEAVQSEQRPRRDNCRIVVNGSFCEQPPLNLIKSIEMAGCYVVDDDYVQVNRWLKREVPSDGDPFEALASAFLHHSADTAAKYAETEEQVGRQLLESVERNRAEGVIFAAPSFCDPALLWRPMLADKLSRKGIPHISFKYSENAGQMAPIREQAGTFADSLKLWS
ncbi:MAG TPA: benzoyl-CoA reductase subunit C [Sedimenticola thiotaurini]|uniref:Benzoyl-CoA reductase subunit C n=1 Tax=Sedimenticola thiotaurini TaxID=1543721 RepID=A0A831RL12_9GAMM|nr:benzoyl-CoA reductase subunit C [Sedimenticola thiotaurini]